MTAALELLLSRHYDGALAPEHAADLARSGLSQDTIRTHYVRSVPPMMIQSLLGFDSSHIVSAILFPFRSPAGGFMNHVCVKVFPALTDDQGHAVKYLQARRTPPRLYFPVPTLKELRGERPLWLVEGQKKALAVAQVGLPALGFCGIEGWHVKGSRELISDFDAISLVGRTVEVLPDGDIETNPMVAQGVDRLALALRRRGARVRLVLLPNELSAA